MLSAISNTLYQIHRSKGSLSLLQDTLDFIAHSFGAGIAEMDPHLVGGPADFLYQRGGVFRRSGRSGACGLHDMGFFVHGAPFSGRGCAIRQNSYSLLRFTMSFAACLVAPAFSSRKFFPSKRIGAHPECCQTPHADTSSTT